MLKGKHMTKQEAIDIIKYNKSVDSDTYKQAQDKVIEYIEILEHELEQAKVILKAREYHPYNNSTRFI
jgi:hypothetical protein